jgi:3-hydroxyisobutyrate dehydrogenase-like beta-hydroxyacid dehydrogenase
MSMRTAVLGMGHMGRAIAGRLLGGGHEVTVWNRTADRAVELVALGAAEAATAADAVMGAEAVFISLADDTAVRSVVSETLLARLGDAVLVDASTVSPQTTAELAAAVPRRSLAAPILGSPAAVAAGEAAYLIAGERAAYDRLAPAFETLAEETRRLYFGEDATLASTLKLLSNYLLMSGIAALSEVVATAQAAGLPDAMISAYFGQLPLVAPALRNRLEDVVSGDHQGWFATRLGAKDMRLAAELGASHGLALPIAQAIGRRYEEASAAGWADADIGAVIELLRSRSAS